MICYNIINEVCRKYSIATTQQQSKQNPKWIKHHCLKFKAHPVWGCEKGVKIDEQVVGVAFV